MESAGSSGPSSTGADSRLGKPHLTVDQVDLRAADPATRGHVLTGMPSQHMALDAIDAQFPMKAGEGILVAEPDAALKAAMDYYSHQMTGHSQPQELIDTSAASDADSAAAIR